MNFTTKKFFNLTGSVLTLHRLVAYSIYIRYATNIVGLFTNKYNT
jgi:hypothetical protein